MADQIVLIASPTAIEGIKEILGLEDSQVESLGNAFSNERPSSAPWAFAHRVADVAKDVPERTIQTIMRSFASMVPVLSTRPRPMTDFIESLTSAVDTDRMAVVKDEEKDMLRARLTTLLGEYNSAYVTAKAFDTEAQHQYAFNGASVNTDMRSVITEGPDVQSKGIILFHNLNIRYTDAGVSQEMHITLNQNDISELKKVLARAELESSILSETLKRSGVSQIGDD